MNDKEETRSSPFSQKLNEILVTIRKGQTDGISELEDLSKDHPDVPEILGHLAWALAHKQRYEKSVQIYRHILRIQPDNFDIQWRIADRLINLGRLEEALEEYQKVLNKHPECIDAQVGIQYAKYLLRKRDKNKELFTPVPREFSQRQQENKILNKQEFQNNRLKLKSLPSQLYLESTTKCNYYCQTCSKGYAPYYAEDLHQDIFDKVRNEIMPSVCRISITGFGEPTMASHFDDILEMALKNGSQVHFITNASLFNFGRIEQLTSAFVDIHISIDGASKEIFEEIRAGSRFEQIIEKLAMIKKLRDIYLFGFYSRFSFNFVAIRKNIHELPDVIKLAHRFGIKDVVVADYAFGYREFDEQSLRYDPQKANHFFHEAKKLAYSLGINLELPPSYKPAPTPLPGTILWEKLKKITNIFPAPKRFPKRCHSPWMEPYINTNGIVTPCCASREYLGNLKDHSFRQIWNGWRYRLLRLRIHSPFPSLGCRQCFVSWGINGGNVGNVISREGLLIKSFYFIETRFGKILRNAIRILKRHILGYAEPQSPAPNYYRGRSLEKSSNGKQSSGLGKLA